MTDGHRSDIRLGFDVNLDPAAAWAVLLDELGTALLGQGLAFVGGPAGRVTQGTTEVGRVVAWHAEEKLVLEWHPASWAFDETSELEIRVEPREPGARLTVEQRGWGGLLGDASERTGWFASAVVAPFLGAMAPEALGDWLTDRRARRPTGAAGRASYRDPLYHYPGFRVILEELALTPADYLLEVGCGGGALLKAALQSGCRAAAIDHSPEMVRVAREANRDAIRDDRLEIHEGDAGRLPFPDASFTCATMTGVLGFLADPVAVLAEMRRVLAPGARLVIQGSDPELRGTPAAPEPMASRLHFYELEELAELGRAAGFSDVRAVHRPMEAIAREVGIPEEHLPLFSGPGGSFLLARKD